MRELEVHTPASYDALVPAYLEFVRDHRGRRTTHQLENALTRFFQWMARAGVTELHQLSPERLRDFLSSLERVRPATIAVQASALRGWLGALLAGGAVQPGAEKLRPVGARPSTDAAARP